MFIIITVYAESHTLKDNYAFGNLDSFGQLLTAFIDPLFSIAGVLVVLYFLFGVVKLLTSGGEKQAIASARDTITHAIIGFVLLIVVFILVKFIPEALGLVNYNVIQ